MRILVSFFKTLTDFLLRKITEETLSSILNWLTDENITPQKIPLSKMTKGSHRTIRLSGLKVCKLVSKISKTFLVNERINCKKWLI